MPANVQVTIDDYVESIGFTTYAYLTRKITRRDLIKGSERSLGEFLEHFLRGKLAEFAFKKYLSTLRIEALIDVDLPIWIDGEYLPDILATRIDTVWAHSRFWPEVKAVVPKQQWMLIPTTVILGGRTRRNQPRPYCAYVICRVDLPPDHVMRLIRYWPKISERISGEWVSALKDLESVSVEILGYALFTDINSILREEPGDVASLDAAFGNGNWRLLKKRESFMDPQLGERYGGFNRDNCIVRLSNLRTDWNYLATCLRQNRPLAPAAQRNLAVFDAQMDAALEALSSGIRPSWFTMSLAQNNDPQSSLGETTHS